MTPERVHRIRAALRGILALSMVAIGALHLVRPEPFTHIVPAWLPAPMALVLLSGVAEILGGAGLLVPGMRRAASLGLVLLYVAVFPANVNMALRPELGGAIPSWLLWARLPFQAAFIALALWVGVAAPGVRKREA